MSTSTPSNINVVPDLEPEETDFTEFYDQFKAEFSAIPEEECAPVNTDVGTASLNGITAGSRCLVLKPEVVQHLPTFDVSLFDKLGPIARASAQAHANFTLASTPTESLAELEQKLRTVRATFIQDIRALETRGLIDASKLGELENPRGLKNLAFGVLSLAAHLRAAWSTVAARTGATAEEIAAAQDLAQRMLAAVSNRQVKPEVGPAALARRQAFTLLVRTHTEVLRAVTYLRPGRDLDTWCPPLYFNARSGKAAQARPEADASTQADAAAAVPTGFAPVVTPGTSSPARPGMPGESPV